ncbi:MAG: ABC transporter ATP-binding protein [Anaerolineae bacterium]|nr:ABC transporter ATP-binding protein [Thermoflexales bacterium]MDW8053556.1 ABC transporter ATP-binding protein [Anaerolineae bacterium]
MSTVPSGAPLLYVTQLSKAFRGVQALHEYALSLRPYTLLGVIGPNGAGKTTLFNILTGVVTPDRGRIVFDGRDLTGAAPDAICRAGIARTFQNIRLFRRMSVLDNVKVALQARQSSHFFTAVLRPPRFYAQERMLSERAMALLATLGLDAHTNLQADALPYGLQRRLEIAMALATEPKLLLLDEPAAGMNPTEADALMHLIVHLRDALKLTIILIEHNMRVVMGICERVQVLNYGQLIAEGTPEEVQNDLRVLQAYLGANTR